MCNKRQIHYRDLTKNLEKLKTKIQTYGEQLNGIYVDINNLLENENTLNNPLPNKILSAFDDSLSNLEKALNSITELNQFYEYEGR